MPNSLEGYGSGLGKKETEFFILTWLKNSVSLYLLITAATDARAGRG
jgi:hypothetical protein